MKNTAIIIALLFSISVSATVKDSTKLNKTGFSLEFKNVFGTVPFEFKKEYTTAFGEKLSFVTLNYFISNIKLTKKDGTEYIVPQDNSYFLVKHLDTASHTLQLNSVPAGKYKSITFTIGVDSVRNTMDVSKRTGALDVGDRARGMYWVWNSGYIFFKLEGKTVNEVDSLSKNFQYHIGGYGGYETKTINNIKVKTIDLGKMRVSSKKHPTIHIQVDIAKFFDNVNPLKVAEHRSAMGGPFSGKIAENYFNIFNVENVTY